MAFDATKVKVSDRDGIVINPATEEKQDAIIAYQENHICTDNTSTTPLAGGATFTGAWQDCLNYQEVNISIDTDKNSATDGLVIEWSADGINIADSDKFSVYANAGTNYTPNPAFRYVRVKYTNGATIQTRFNLMTILRRGATGGSFHRISDTLKDDSDGRLNLSVLKLRTAQNNYVSGAATNAGNFKVSLEEIESSVDIASETKQDTQIEKTSEEAILLRRIVKLLESNATVDIANRQRVSVEGLSSTTLGRSVAGLDSGVGVPVPNQPVDVAAPRPAPNATYWQPVWPGPVDPRYTNMEQAKINYNTGIRSALSFH